MQNHNSAIFYQGPSLIDGTPILGVVSGLQRGSRNPKTGQMVQTHVILEDISPSTARKAGKDVSVCGKCPLRTTQEGGCYVKLFAQIGVFKSYKRGRLKPTPVEQLATQLAGKAVRIGSYGQPSAIPIKAWRTLLSKVKTHCGYDGRWRSVNRSWADIVMASVRSQEEKKAANLRGFRTFRILFPGDKTQKDEVLCLASKQAPTYGKVTCSTCGLCNGLAGRLLAKTRNVAIHLHGPRASKANR